MIRTFFFATVLVAGWWPAAGFAQTVKSNNLETEIKQLLTAQVDAWNDGDLKKFMSTYWNSEKLSFSSGGKTTFGWKATLSQYQQSYSPPKEMGKLRFSKLLVTPIEENSTLVLGNWHLTKKDRSNPQGNFSLVLKKIEGDWKIIHDHTSLLKETESDDSIDGGSPKKPEASD